MREPSWSLVPVAKCGFSSVGDCHQRTFSAPPPPRFVGAYWTFVCAVATPAEVSIWAASGAVTPRPIIMWTKPRRLSAPTRTCSIKARSWPSFMSASSLKVMMVASGLVPVRQPPHVRVPAVEIHALQARVGSADAVAPHDGNDDDVRDDEVVHPDEQRRPL